MSAEAAVDCKKHEWKIVLGLVLFPNGKDGFYEYQVKCTKCGYRDRLSDEIMTQVFKNGDVRCGDQS